MSVKYRVRFKKDVTVERAHKDKTKGGFHLERIRRGTEQEMNSASIRYWNSRDANAIDVLGSVEAVNPFALPALDASERMRLDFLDKLQAAFEAGRSGDRTRIAAELSKITASEIEEFCGTDVPRDALIVLCGAIEESDAGEMKHVSLGDFTDAIAEIISAI
jgi:hypothetical protein